MKLFRNPVILGRILIPLVVISLLGLGARSHSATEALKQARLAINSESPAEAAEWLGRAAEQLPLRADLWESAGNYATAAGDYLAAIEYYTQADKIGRLSSAGQEALGEAYQHTGDVSSAVQVWESSLAKNGQDGELFWLLAQAFRQMEDYPSAILYLEKLTQFEPTNASAHYELGLILAAVQPEAASAHLVQAAEQDEQFSEAVNILQSALRSAQFDNPPAFVFASSGQALGSIGEWNLAQAALLNAVQKDPYYFEAWAFLGETRQQLGEDGYRELEAALALNPDALSTNVLMSLYWQRQNEPEQALPFLEKAVLIDPNNPALQVDLGALQLILGDLSASLAHYQRATEMAPQDPRYWQLLAAFAIDNEVFIENVGLPAALTAVELNPQDASALVLLARAYFLLEDNLNAETNFRFALEADPDFAPAHLYLGIYYLATGNHSAARQHLSIANQLDPEGAIGQQANSMLEQYFP
ncbi:MAG: tetratricopeptide repeat protein [Chloroflexi bacterium]|nr:tetratricopeptide repeat protein [Chloroflexota bacterium]